MRTRFPLKTVKVSLAVKVALTLLVLVYAANLTISLKHYTGEQGSYLTVTNNLLSVDKGFTKASSGLTATGLCPTENVTFTSTPTTANTTVTAGHIVFDAQVNTTTTTPALRCFTVTLDLSMSNGSHSTYTVKIATGSSVSAGWTIDCKFDVGATLPASPFSFKIIVQ